jgi:leucyl/phenylalanyl-tRNA--protein transferase
VEDHPSLAPEALLAAYAEGAFPMDEEGATGAVGLYTCEPRGVIPLDRFRVPRSVRRALRRRPYEIEVDTAFAEVAAACAGPRVGGTWLTPRLVRAYVRLHEEGWAHSVEAWDGDRLVGGLFGVALNGLFTSETMFHRAPDAGNAVLVATARLLREAGYILWDIQMTSPHTSRFGAVGIPPHEYMRLLAAALRAGPRAFPSSP